MNHYVGILDGGNGVWGIRFPDMPGCYAGGESIQATIADAISALQSHAAYLESEGVTLAPSRSVDDVLASESLDHDLNESIVLIPLLRDYGRSVKANITLDAGLLLAIDAEAKLRGVTRSAFLAGAARDKIAERR